MRLLPRLRNVELVAKRRWLGLGALSVALSLSTITCSGGNSGAPLGGAGSSGTAGLGAAGTSAAGTNGTGGTTGGAAGATGTAGGGVAGATGTAGSPGTGGSVIVPCADCVEFGLATRPANPTCVAGAPPPTAYKFVRIWAGVPLGTVLDIVPTPNGTEMILAQKSGIALAVPMDPAATTAQARTFLDLHTEINLDAESGLLSFAFDPNYKTNGFAYGVYTRNDGMHSTRVARWKTNDNGKTLDLASELKIWEHTQIRGTHHGGDLKFGADGFLYVSFGDNNSGDDHKDFTAAKTDTLYGKLVRLDVNGATAAAPYKIPPDNPFADGTKGRPEIYARGLRNPWRFSFDRSTHELWLADPGEETNGIKGADGIANPYERLNKIVKGGFYGWPYWQGTHCYHDCTLEMGLPPEYEFDHAGGPAAVVGGFVYRGTALPGLVGKYVYGNYSIGQTFIYDPTTKKATGMAVGGKPVAFGQDNDGELYVSREDGTIEKLQNSVIMGTTGGFPTLLSQTGCVMPTDATKPVAAMIPFSVALPFWSDGAEKERFLAVPDGQTIAVAADGDFTLPPGGVTMKNFRWQGKLFETRFFVRHNDGSYYGYSYEWNDAGTDATKVAETGKDKTLTGLAWTYPSTSGCFTCHSEAAGRSLGLETRQLNFPGLYGTAKANQFKTLQHIGLLSGNMTALAAFPAKDDATVAVDTRARAYLAVNCSNCHRPNGPGRGVWNALFDTPFKDMKICNAVPEQGDLGVTGATLLKPGMHASSLIWMRMSQRTMSFMPPLATKLVDTVGADLLGKWTDGVTACP
jgi:uncharacterized repeat protein (TIGR03806 family)